MKRDFAVCTVHFFSLFSEAIVPAEIAQLKMNIDTMLDVELSMWERPDNVCCGFISEFCIRKGIV